MSATTDHTESVLTPGEAMRFVEREQRAHDARMAAPVPAILLTWGIAWPAIYLLLWAGGWAMPLPGAIAAAVGAVAVVAAFLGTPAGLLALAIGGGLPLLGLALAQTIRARRAAAA